MANKTSNVFAFFVKVHLQYTALFDTLYDTKGDGQMRLSFAVVKEILTGTVG